jgi:hypothetical protein
MLAIIVVNLCFTLVYPVLLWPIDFDHVAAFPAKEFLGEPDMDFGRGCRDEGVGGRFGAPVFGVGAGQWGPTGVGSKQKQQKTKNWYFKAQRRHQSPFLFTDHNFVVTTSAVRANKRLKSPLQVTFVIY